MSGSSNEPLPGSRRRRFGGLYDPAFEHESCGIGFVAQLSGEASHRIVADAAQMLEAMEHRGAVGAEPNTGDGAGILTSMPRDFLARVAGDELGVELPAPGRFAVGNVFLPTEKAERRHCRRTVEEIVHRRGHRLAGWRRVPVRPDEADLGPTARDSQPAVEQLFVLAADRLERDAFERELYLIRKLATRALHRSHVAPEGRQRNQLSTASLFYVASLSSKVVVYKGMFTPRQLVPFYPDLADRDYRAHVAMVHSRFSTNTFPSWDRAQPCRYMSHNGEINTLRGNVNWLHARQGAMKSPYFSDADLRSLFPVIEPDTSDSGSFDNALELLLMAGRSLPEAIMMMIPEAWEHRGDMAAEKRAFYEYHSCLQEPWDGPASIVLTDGDAVGAVLDRNGLRPSRYTVTTDGRIIMASESGLLAVAPEEVEAKGRLEPGRLLLVDFDQRRIVPDDELKRDISRRRPYGRWLKRQRLELRHLSTDGPVPGFDAETLMPRLRAFGYTIETLHFMLGPLVEKLRDPLGSMGNDSPLACLSDRPRLPYDYFRQLFAQVTNPAIDSIREEVIMSLQCHVGPEGNLLETTEGQCGRLLIRHPILRNPKLAALRDLDRRGWRTRTIDITYEQPALERPGVGNGGPPAAAPGAGEALAAALERICGEAESAVDEGLSLVILSDRAAGPDRVPVSALLACGAVHHHLVGCEKRTRIGLLVETGEAREVHHHCLLVGYGADGVNPYLAYEALWHARRHGMLSHRLRDDDAVVAAYRKGVAKGMLKVMAKMGISTLQSYKGAQIFEALGLAEEVVERCFAGTPSRIRGVGFDVLATEALARHALGYPARPQDAEDFLPNPGEFHWRAGGERHAWSPEPIAALQVAARTDSREAYRRFARFQNEDLRARCDLRGVLRLRPAERPLTPAEVEPAERIVRRFRTGAMSFGSISPETHETLAIAMNRLGGKSNSGEGGEDPARYRPLPTGDSKRSAIKQVASGRFGVTAWYLANADEIQIKIAQGAKPGEGGELPGRKVDERIARVRFSTPGVGLISPPPHHDIYSIEDLKQLIHDLKSSNPAARVSVKLVSEVGVGTIAAGVAKGHADHILISGASGGTGASPLTSIKHAGLPWELGLAETHQTLVANDLRGRVVLETDGGLKTGRDVVVACLLGAEEFGFSTAPLVALGCIMMRKCHLNTCPVGIATQDPALRKKFAGRPEHLVRYLFLVAEEVREIMAELGFATVDEMVGRVDRLEADPSAGDHWKARGVDLSPLLAAAEKPRPGVAVRCVEAQDHGLESALDGCLIELARPAIERGEGVEAELEVRNTDLTVGTQLSHRIVSSWGEDGLPDDSVRFRFAGAAGQSFGAFLCSGVTFTLEGDANDYVGKGLCGGRLVLRPPAASRFAAEDNVIAGNVVLYGATSGQAFLRGRAAERFCVRNSGAEAVVEGVGDHGCEYMTGGRAVILGATGRNFAAGMSGGVAYVWDPAGAFNRRLNPNSVLLEEVEDEADIYELRNLIALHRRHTGSTVAATILDDWNERLGEFRMVMPLDYKRVLRERARHDEEAETPVHGELVDG